MTRIIFPVAGNGVAVLSSDDQADILQVARKDVPEGVPFRVVDDVDIPEDRSQRDLWTADFSEPDGYGIGPEAWFEEQVAAEVEA